MSDWFDAIRNLIDVEYIQRSVRLLVVGGGRVSLAFTQIAISHGVRWVRVIDPDWCIRRNFASGFPESAVGRPKAAYFREELQRQSSRISFEAASVSLSAANPGVLLEWLPRCTHVALFIDSFDVASAVARLVYKYRPCIYAAVLENGSVGEAAWSLPGRTPCLECTAKLSQKRGAEGGETMLVDVVSTVTVAVRQFLGLCLVGGRRRGFELFARYADPRYCLAFVINRPGGFVETGRVDMPGGVRLVQVVEHGVGPSCSTCRGYRLWKGDVR